MLVAECLVTQKKRIVEWVIGKLADSARWEMIAARRVTLSEAKGRLAEELGKATRLLGLGTQPNPPSSILLQQASYQHILAVLPLFNRWVRTYPCKRIDKLRQRFGEATYGLLAQAYCQDRLALLDSQGAPLSLDSLESAEFYMAKASPDFFLPSPNSPP
jgi:hypothetical protein